MPHSSFDPVSLDYIYWPVSAILWFWHQAFGYVFGDSSGVAWALAVVFLVFTLRGILFKPFVHQVRSMRKMQEFSPEIKKLQKKYANDKQKLAAEMQKLQSEHGVNPVGGCLPVLVQVPVFIGLFHVLRGFNPHYPFNYIFDRDDIVSFNDAHLFGAKLGATLWHFGPYAKDAVPLEEFHTTVSQQLVVMIPLMIAAGIFTHLTARHSVARQTEAQLANPQSAIMNKLQLYLFPIGVVVGAPFLPLAILFYWVSNNLWTMGQQRLVYKKIDAEEAEKVEHRTEVHRNLAPKVGQKPNPAAKQKKPGAKPVEPRRPAGPKDGSEVDQAAVDAESTEESPVDSPAGSQGNNGASGRNGAAKKGSAESGGNGARVNGTGKTAKSNKPKSRVDGTAKAGGASNRTTGAKQGRKRQR